MRMILPGAHCSTMTGALSACRRRPRPNDPLGRKVGEFLGADGDYGYAEQLAELKKNTLPERVRALPAAASAPEDGDYFRPSGSSHTIKPAARYDARLWRLDYAVTADGGDHTVHAVVGLRILRADVPPRSMAQTGVVGHVG